MFIQDPEEGFGIGVTAEVAIDILVKSYGSSEIRNQVQNVVAKISESVSSCYIRHKKLLSKPKDL